MRLLMTADTIGGVWTYAVELCRSLSKKGFEIGLATMGQRLNSGQRRDAQMVRQLQIFESDFRLEWMEDPWRDVDDAGDWLLGIERSFKPDIVHLNGYAHGSLGWRAPHVVVCHSCVMSWSAAIYGRRAAFNVDREYRARVESGLKSAKHIVAPTYAMLREVFDFYRCGDCPASVVPNGRNAMQFFAGAKKPYVFTAGRIWDCAKNISSVARVAPLLPWPVFVAGSGEISGSEFRHCQVLGQLNHTEISYWFADASIYCSPAKYEPFGLSILEAALSGCALVLGDIPSLREIWDGAAVFVNPTDDFDLASALNALIQNPTWRHRLGRNARERAVVFSPRRMTNDYLAIYRTAISSSEHLRAEEAVRCAS
jgi:glycogen synthase